MATGRAELIARLGQQFGVDGGHEESDLLGFADVEHCRNELGAFAGGAAKALSASMEAGLHSGVMSHATIVRSVPKRPAASRTLRRTDGAACRTQHHAQRAPAWHPLLQFRAQ